MGATITCDVAIVGGGLAGGLIALALARARPDARVLIVEAGGTLGGHHVWSFFGADVAGADRALVEPLVAHRWPGYAVRFPDRSRAIAEPYHSITSERFDAVVRAGLPDGAVLLGRAASEVGPRHVALADGDRIAAGGVIDARGTGDLSRLDLGWQKFVGRELMLDAAHGLDRPIVMDADVPQLGGYRFVYTLPFAADVAFVEDTYYADGPEIDGPEIDARIDAYAAARGWRVAGYGRREAAALPVAMGGDFDAYWASGGAGVAKAGMRAALFHPVTGYSLPDAVRTAALIAAAPDLSEPALHDLTRAHARAAWDARGLYRLLSRMLFRAAEPAERWRVLARFYRLDPMLISRFYAARSTFADKARILMGRPPVPLLRALKVLA